MYFLINDNKKGLIGWSAKCACSAIKWWFADVSRIDVGNTPIHQFFGYGDTEWTRLRFDLRNNYRSYKKFILIRNPYKRLVSGYVNKYVIEKAYENKGWSNFEEFVTVLESDRKFKKINKHHFTPQTSEAFYKAVIYRWTWDYVLNVDTLQQDIEELNKILDVNGKLAHHNKTNYNRSLVLNKPAYLMTDSEISEFMPSSRNFYNKTILKKVGNIYQHDFKFFKSLGFSFELPI